MLNNVKCVEMIFIELNYLWACPSWPCKHRFISTEIPVTLSTLISTFVNVTEHNI